MELDEDDAATVDRLLRTLMDSLRERDVTGVVSLFDSEAVLFGSESGETATGHQELQIFFRRLFARPQTYAWEWEELSVRGAGGVVWFVGPATVVIRGDDGTERKVPYRLCGVLQRQSKGRWLFVLFNGAEPVAAETA